MERPSIAQWGCFILLVGIIAGTIVVAVWLFTRSPASPDGPQPTAVVWTATPTPTATSQPTLTPLPAAESGAISVGQRVQVSGTGGVGLSMRADASTNAERREVAQEGEVLLVVGGPQEADGYTWWLLRDEENPTREGWAAADFLVPAN
ncbi:MAG: hypothetical protein ACP5JG_01915 [Anaerolineae bacterium]